MHAEWLSEDTARLRDEPEGEVRGVLVFNDTSAEWYVGTGKDDPTADVPLGIDRDLAEELRQERERLAPLMESVRIPLEAEWRGRVHMFRDETRRLALLGAGLVIRKGFRQV